jgi:ABC-type branched-subunit amino acid transport system ATPase component
MDNILETQSISISFGGIKAVQNVSFNIQRGEILGLIGPNGSGKTTVINLLSGLYQTQSGEIAFDGTALTNRMDMADRANIGIGRTFQSPKPFGHLSVYHNLYAIAIQRRSKEKAHEKVLEVLALTNLAVYANMLSSKLSIEKRKWMDLARVLTNDPKLIMMDEVMAGMNPSEMQESLLLIKKINELGITILFVEHVMPAVIQLCTRAIVLNEGKLLCDGEPHDILRRDDVVKAYLGGGHYA